MTVERQGNQAVGNGSKLTAESKSFGNDSRRKTNTFDSIEERSQIKG